MKLVSLFKALWLRMRYPKKLSLSSLHNRISGSFNIKIDNDGKIRIAPYLHTKRNVTIHADGGNIDIGKNVFLNENCTIVSHKEIVIGDNATIGPNVCIYDHDHNYKSTGYISDEVFIGKNVWIGANVVILRGTHLGDGCVVGAGTVVRGNFQKDTLIVQEHQYKTKSIDRG